MGALTPCFLPYPQIGITNLVNDNLLRDLSSPPQRRGETWFSSPDFQNLENVLDTLVKRACVVPTQPPGGSEYIQSFIANFHGKGVILFLSGVFSQFQNQRKASLNVNELSPINVVLMYA